MNRLLVIAIAGFAALSLASASFANPFTTEVRGQLDTDAYGYSVDTLATGDYSSATTSVATVHDYTLINYKTNLKGDARWIETRASGRDDRRAGNVGQPGDVQLESAAGELRAEPRVHAQAVTSAGQL